MHHLADQPAISEILSEFGMGDGVVRSRFSGIIKRPAPGSKIVMSVTPSRNTPYGANHDGRCNHFERGGVESRHAAWAEQPVGLRLPPGQLRLRNSLNPQRRSNTYSRFSARPSLFDLSAYCNGSICSGGLFHLPTSAVIESQKQGEGSNPSALTNPQVGGHHSELNASGGPASLRHLPKEWCYSRESTGTSFPEWLSPAGTGPGSNTATPCRLKTGPLAQPPSHFPASAQTPEGPRRGALARANGARHSRPAGSHRVRVATRIGLNKAPVSEAGQSPRASTNAGRALTPATVVRAVPLTWHGDESSPVHIGGR